MLEKTLETPLCCREIQPVHSEGDQPWDFFGRNDAKAETHVLWGNSGNSSRLYFGETPKPLQLMIAAMKLKDAYSLEEKL